MVEQVQSPGVGGVVKELPREGKPTAFSPGHFCVKAMHGGHPFWSGILARVRV